MTQGPFPRLGEFEILAPISEGGMGSVSLGRRVARPNELVALKVIRAEYGRNKEFVAMLVDEARLASRLSHPNILSTRALGEDGKQHFLVMELLRGRTLLDVSKAAHARAKRLPYEVVAWIGARIADALHYAHELADDAGFRWAWSTATSTRRTSSSRRRGSPSSSISASPRRATGSRRPPLAS
ncbi:MAG: protein kinase [Polyangiaceae bacterium]|jgi:serine/threonine-protein kinase